MNNRMKPMKANADIEIDWVAAVLNQYMDSPMQTKPSGD